MYLRKLRRLALLKTSFVPFPENLLPFNLHLLNKSAKVESSSIYLLPTRMLGLRDQGSAQDH